MGEGTITKVGCITQVDEVFPCAIALPFVDMLKKQVCNSNKFGVDLQPSTV